METPREHESPVGGDRTPKRRRLPRSSSRRAQTSTPKPQQPREMELSQPPEQPQSPSTASLPRQETRAEVLARHKAWRECGTSGDLKPCDTCRKSFHATCQQQSVAIIRESWHIEPPMVTPPVSPPSGDHDTLDTSQRTTESRNEAKASSARKSRFNTLPIEVDSALWTVYRELENGTILQTKVTNLERDVTRLHQVVQMHMNETLAAGGVIRKLRAELETVRREAADRHADSNEKHRLEARNKELELEVTDTRRQLETANRTLLEWKQHLTALIGDRASSLITSVDKNGILKDQVYRRANPEASQVGSSQSMRPGKGGAEIPASDTSSDTFLSFGPT
ncbi:uncharacterized protein NECHADRAFT_75607 [Fusarium vanettenii 77-13-4]|uniref:Zinc finger PHD-type domain-containing protein n=1 Tax=Fusarium vanettenii (strain ATCC MYA-4622 / CBS 123669 / FGSC 9596 / NRRL 45880 / 77-13-4) TaxID=660122 RepID=C7YJA1_FUSV7|nr:uncharacterized protein NECHADRAFT_75607 [Fusarium vanettenii 77-13-4]EEU48235.1 hypothetical protein NECHADRAFT_75607 [Fusarium vanettenii 77-13-4]